MRRTLIRQISVGTAVALVTAAAAGAAFAAARDGHGRFGPRGSVNAFRAGGFGQPGGLFGFGRLAGGGGLGGPGFGGPRFGPGFDGPGFGGPGGPGGGGILAADILGPAATFLKISPSTLATDLKKGNTLAQEATANGKTASDLISAIVAAEKTILDTDVTAGWITSDQETSILGGLTKQITSLVNDGPPVPGTRPAGLLDTAATYFGKSVSELPTALKSGKTLAEITTTAGKTVDGLVAALEAPAKTNLDAAVTAGKITQAQETAILSNMTTHLTDLVNGKAGEHEANTVRKNLRKFASLRAFGLKASTRR